MAGVVHFSWYFRYMEEAEHGMWRAAGLSVASPADDLGWPRVAASFEYRRPLKFEDEFDVYVRVTEIGDRTITFACDISREDKPIAHGAMTVACVRHHPDGTMRAIPIPPEIAGRFEVARDVV
jgi:YbgC/YbaW family acyl-CoA thioester hydrolase